MNWWPLCGIAIVVLGFALRLNAVLVVVTAGFAAGLAAGLDLGRIVDLIGESAARFRFLLLFVLLLPVIGLLEQHGLREQAQAFIVRLRRVGTGRLLLAYLALRQLSAMAGLVSLGGHPQTVRPLLAPMAEGKAEAALGPLPAPVRERLRAMCAATDNVGLFFGEDVFVAFGAVLLMQAFLAGNGIEVTPLAIALWGLPTAAAAFLIHGARLARLDARLAREVAALARAGARRT